MLGTAKTGSSMPGGWGKDSPAVEKNAPSYSEEVEAREQGENLAAGIIGKTGEVVDETGKTVGKVTEGNVGDLVGNVVTATGDIIGKDGGIVGKALPLQQVTEGLTDPEAAKSGGGFSVLGAAKGVKGVVDTVDGTVQTVNRTLPIVGDLTKGLGLGGNQSTKDTETADDAVTGILSEKPEDRDPEEKLETTEEAKKELFEDNDAISEVAPIALKDEEPHLNGKLTGDNTQSETEPTEDGKTELGDGEQKNLAELDPIPEADDIKDNIPDVEEAKDKIPPTEEAKDNIPDTDEVKDNVPDTEEAKDNTPDVEKAEDAIPDTEEVKDNIPEDVKDADIPKSELGTEGDLPVTVAGDKLLQPFEKFAGAEINDEGKVIFENESIGKLAEGDAADLVGKTVDAEGNILNDSGSIIGKAELKTELQEEFEKEAGIIDFSILKGAKVNKAGNLTNDKGEAIGRITEGILKHLIGKKADENGQIWNDGGKIIGKAEPIPDTEREEFKESPFEDFAGATVESDGHVMYNGEIVGRVIEGDAKKLKGKKVDEDGDILDRNGNTIGKAERWEPEPEKEPEPEPEVDKSILAGKRVNKAGNVVDSSGTIFGRIIEGDIKRLQGRMCDKQGNVRSESGDILGKAELVSEGEREGFKEGPFAELPGCTINKEGKVVTPAGDVVGRLVSGDPKVLFGRAIDEDGDVLDRNGNTIGKAERWDEPVVEKKKGPMAGRRVNRQGEVVDEDGNVIGKLTTGELSICAGKEIDDDGDVVDSKGRSVGHVSLLADIPAPPPPKEEETPEEKKSREEAEADKKLAKSLGACVEQCLDKIRPICKMITQKIDKAERTPKDELDEEDLVKQVKPLIEEGNKILNEANGTIRALDPDGRIQRQAKHKSATRDASPEEYHLADVLKELTGTITECIDGAKRKIEDMPHAKKELNPLWGLLTEPLFQILAAVGLLLTGVLNIVGRLLSGLGLGGLVDGLLGTLGLTKVLDSLGAGSIVGALTGKSQKKK